MPSKFVIVTHPRSGTHMLATSLGNHNGLGRIRELFNLTNAMPPSDDRVEEIIRRLDSINWFDQTRNSGFIIHFEQDQSWKVLDFLSGFSCKYICLSRTNQLARVVSIEQVLHHNLWQCRDSTKIPTCVEVEISPDKYSKMESAAARDWDRFYNSVPSDQTYQITYEQLCSDVHQAVEGVCGFLGIECDASMVPQTVKTTTTPISQIVTNFNELWNKFHAKVYNSVNVNGIETPAIRLVPNSVVGAGQHHSGWPFIVESLRKYSHENGMLFDDYVDRSFGYQKKYVPYKEPWVGIVHHPTDASNWVKEAYILPNIVEQKQWIKSEPYLKALICLSDFSKKQIEPFVGVPVYTVKHPIEMPSKTFNWDEFALQDEKRIVQLGYYCRNTLAICQLPNIPGFTKTRVWNNSVRWINARDRNLRSMFSGIRPYLGDTEHWDRLDNDEYDDVLSKSVVFLELFTASANNVIVECIARNTPVIVNRLPAIEEYLGSDYPLFYDNFYEAPRLFNMPTIWCGHEYLKTMDKSYLSIDSFTDSIFRIVRDVNN